MQTLHKKVTELFFLVFHVGTLLLSSAQPKITVELAVTIFSLLTSSRVDWRHPRGYSEASFAFLTYTIVLRDIVMLLGSPSNANIVCFWATTARIQARAGCTEKLVRLVKGCWHSQVHTSNQWTGTTEGCSFCLQVTSGLLLHLLFIKIYIIYTEYCTTVQYCIT